MVQDGLKRAIILFILREIIFFFAWFWGFFHSRLSPNNELGILWPPSGLYPLDPLSVPVLNTFILLSSGVSVTWAHHLSIGNKNITKQISLTIFLGLLFTGYQLLEYLESLFCLGDSIFGRVFFVTTGFHGVHVILGTLLLASMFRLFSLKRKISRHALGFDFAIWYWHFVDVVWLFLVTFYYFWGI